VLTKVNLLLLALVMGFGMLLVQTSYEARRLYSEVDRAKAEGERLAADAQRLAAERHQQSTSIRVEQVAREKMNMRLIAPSVVQPVVLPASSAEGGKP
jgi:cell division protein FtsL